MKREFNLLGAAPRSVQRAPSARQLSWVAAATLALALGSGLFMELRADAAERRIAQGNAAIEDLVLGLQERSQFLARRNADPELVQRLQQLERESTDKGRVLELLAGRALGNTDGFSAHLVALGRRHPDGLWLRDLRIDDGGRQMALQGGAVSPDLVPRFLDALRAEPVFRGAAFERFAMSRPEHGGGPVSFWLATACGDAEAAGECPDPAAGEAP